MNNECTTPRERCVPGTTRETLFCVRVPGTDCPVSLRAVTTINSQFCEDTTTVVYDSEGVVFTGDTSAAVRVACPEKVQVCGTIEVAAPPPAPPVDVTANTCAGTVTVATAQTVQAVPHPDAVQPTRDCGNAARDALLTSILAAVVAPKFDREFASLCAPDGTRVAVQNVTPEDAPLGTAPTFEYWDLAGGNWVGDPLTLSACGGEKIDVASPVAVCKDGVEYTRTDFWDIASTPRVLLGSIWQDAAGAVIVPLTAPFSIGHCAEATGFQEVVHWDDNGVCVEGRALYTRNTDNTVVLNGVVDVNGAVVTPAGALVDGPCCVMAPERTAVVVHWNVANPPVGQPCCVSGFAWMLDATGAVDNVTLFDGTVVTPTPTFTAGPCPADKVVEREVAYVDPVGGGGGGGGGGTTYAAFGYFENYPGPQSYYSIADDTGVGPGAPSLSTAINTWYTTTTDPTFSFLTAVGPTAACGTGTPYTLVLTRADIDTFTFSGTNVSGYTNVGAPHFNNPGAGCPQGAGTLWQHGSTNIQVVTSGGGGGGAAASRIIRLVETTDSCGVTTTTAFECDGTPVVDFDATGVSCATNAANPAEINAGGAQVAGATRAATPAFAGAPAAWDSTGVPGSLHSVTIGARGVLDGMPGQAADRVEVTLPNGDVVAMLNNETRTFSVERDSDASLKREYEVLAVGNAYATVTFTYYE